MTLELRNDKILITGGAGFIGSALVRALAIQGAELVIVDNLVNGRVENVADVLGDRIRLEVVDIRDAASLRSLVRGVDVVFHLACLGVRHSIHSPEENHEVNATATLGLLTLARAAGVRRFVYVSTSEVYGTARTVPISEDHPVFPHTVYGAAKLAGECYARAFWRTYDYPTVIVRPFNAFGPRSHHEGDSGEVIPKFVLRAMVGRDLFVFGDGSQTRDFTYVEDTARGILQLGMHPRAAGETFNLGRGEEISIRQLADEIRGLVGNGEVEVQHVEPRPGDVLRLLANTDRARALVGYRPRVSLRDGLQKLIAWYASQGRDPAELLEEERVRNWEPVQEPARRTHEAPSHSGITA